MADEIEDILEQVAGGGLSVGDAARRLRERAAEPLGFATLDHHRRERCGVPEVVYGESKSPEQVVRIARSLVDRCGQALVTRAAPEHVAAVAEAFGDLVTDARRRTLLIGRVEAPGGSPIPIVTAGTSDAAVADEAELTCHALGQRTRRINDVGVAGLNRLIPRLAELPPTGVIICIAGMEGALPSVVGGMVASPVIAVPTSVGYGAAFHGLAALLGMLTSCAAGVSVVNIDNGFGAACTATLIQRQYDASR